MAYFKAFLFQQLKISTAERHELDLGSPTTQSLLAYLLLYRDQRLNRRQVAFLFWPHDTESNARRNLRQYIHRTKRALESVDPDGDLIFTDGSTIQINPQAKIWLDIEVFESKTGLDADPLDLREAIQLYTGNLLENVYDDWCQQERERLRRLYLKSLDRLSESLQTTQKPDEALHFAQRWVAEEPYDEAAHRRLMASFVQLGERHRALQHYQHLKEVLAQELNTEPLVETQIMFQSIQSGLIQPQISRAIVGTNTPPAKSLISLPLIGRQRELKQLQTAQKNSRLGRGQFILITGELGIGKTRLVQEYLAQNPNLLTLQTICHELEAFVPYAPLRQILQNALALLSEEVLQPAPSWIGALIHVMPELSERFPYLLPWQIKRRENIQIADAISNLLMTLSPSATDGQYSQPLHLIFDDLHWGDSQTWEFLGYMTHRASTSPLMIIGACRLEDLSPDQDKMIRTLIRNNLLLHIPLDRLSSEETTDLTRHLISDPPPDDLFLQRLYQETEGNPLFIIEAVRSIQESNRPPRLPFNPAADGSGYQIPLTIQRVIESRLDHLPADSLELLATAAAIGRAFTFSLLSEVSQVSVEKIIQCIEEWLQKGLVRESISDYDFSHDKIRQVAYASLSHARQQYIHRRIADVLNEAVFPTEAATLAYHYARSDQPLQAIPYLTQAGEQALQVRSYREARQFGQQAVSLLGRLPGLPKQSERIDLNLQLAQAYAFSGDLTHALEIIGQTERLALDLGDQIRLGKVFRRAAQIFWLKGQPEAAGDYARRTIRLAEEQGDLHLMQAALRMLGRVGIALSAFDDAIAYLLQYLKLENEDGIIKLPDLPVVYGYLGIAYARIGSWDRAFDIARRGVDQAKSEGSSETVAFALVPLAFVHADYHNWGACLQVLSEIPDPLLEKRELTPIEFMNLGIRGYALANLGEPARGAETIRPALSWLEKTDYRVFHYLPRIFLAHCLLLNNQIEEAREEASNALADARRRGNRWAAGIALRLLAEIFTKSSKPNWLQIENYLIESMHIHRQIRARPELARTFLSLRKLYDRVGQIAWAVDCHFRATTIFDELGMVEELYQAQGQAGGERRGSVVILDLKLRGPNVPAHESMLDRNSIDSMESL